MRKRNWLAMVNTILTIAIVSLTASAACVVNAEETTPSETNTKIVVDDYPLGYFSDKNGTVWEFEAVFIVPEDTDESICDVHTMYANGVILRVSDEEKPYHIQDYSTMTSLRDLRVSPNDLRFDNIELIIDKVLDDIVVYDSDMIASYDYWEDGKISLPDYIMAQRVWKGTPMNFITNGDVSNYQEMSYEDFFEILYQKSETGEKEEITIMYGDVPEVVEPTETTTVTESTTTSTTTTTTTTKPTTTSTTTTTTTKPTTTSTTITTTTTKPTTTSTSTTTTTTKPTTTSTSTTTTTTESTTTSTSTTTTTTESTTTSTSTTTTTTESTTTSTSTTTTTTKPTTTSTSTTTTTTEPTTTSTSTTTTTTTSTTTTESETTETTTTSDSTTVDTEWTKPTVEDLVNDEGQQIDQTTYDILINTAEMFGIDRYEIVWSDHPIEYAYADPGQYYSMKCGMAYGYGVQIASGTDVKTICPDIDNLATFDFEFNEFMCYRPIVEDDNLPEVLEAFDVTYGAYKENNKIVAPIEDIIGQSEEDKYNPFNFANWYLVPIDEEGELIYELNTNEYTEVKTSVELKYWFNNEELSPNGKTLPREDFYMFVKTAELYGFEDFNVVYSETPLFYAYNNGNLYVDYGTPTVAVQLVPTTDLVVINPDIYQELIDEGYSAEAAEELVNKFMDEETYEYYIWVESKYLEGVEHEEDIFYTSALSYHEFNFYMVPLDAAGNEILQNAVQAQN